MICLTSPRVAAADQAVLVHHALAVGEGLQIPVLPGIALPAHRVEAEITRGRHLRVQAAAHGGALAVEQFLLRLLPFRGIQSETAGGQFFIDLAR